MLQCCQKWIKTLANGNSVLKWKVQNSMNSSLTRVTLFFFKAVNVWCVRWSCVNKSQQAIKDFSCLSAVSWLVIYVNVYKDMHVLANYCKDMQTHEKLCILTTTEFCRRPLNRKRFTFASQCSWTCLTPTLHTYCNANHKELFAFRSR